MIAYVDKIPLNSEGLLHSTVTDVELIAATAISTGGEGAVG